MSDRSTPRAGERNARPTKVVGVLPPPKKNRSGVISVTPTGIPVRIHGVSDQELRKMKIAVRRHGLRMEILHHPDSPAFKTILRSVRRDISQKRDNRIRRPGSTHQKKGEGTLLRDEAA